MKRECKYDPGAMQTAAGVGSPDLVHANTLSLPLFL